MNTDRTTPRTTSLVLGVLLIAFAVPSPAAAQLPRPSPVMRTFEPFSGAARAVIWIPCCGAWFSQETVAASHPSYARFEIGAPYIDPNTGVAVPDTEGFALGVPIWRTLGFRVVVTSYRDRTGRFGAQPAGIAVTDSLTQYDRIRKQNPGLKVCAVGKSATGHVALMVSAIRGRDSNPNDSGPDCIVTEGSPTDLVNAPAAGRPYALLAFGNEQGLADNSPAALARTIRSSVLMTSCTTDPVVPSDNPQRIVPELRKYQASKPGQVVAGWELVTTPADENHRANCVHSSRMSPADTEAYRTGVLAFIEAAPKIHP